MTYPPQPGQWNPGLPPPGYYPPPGWSPQPPPEKNGGLKWLLIGVAVLLIIAITIGATLLFTRGGSGSENGKTPAATPRNLGDIASANDVGPVSIITFEPTCGAFVSIHDTLSVVEANGWGGRDPASESSSWTPQVREQYNAVGSAMRSAADQVVPLAKQTPHRVMREMYEQFIAYGRAYADALSSYRPSDNFLSMVNTNVDSSLAGVCDAIRLGSVVTRASLAPPVDPPSTSRTVSDVSEPHLFVPELIPSCEKWIPSTSSFEAGLADWKRVDSSIPETAWTPDQRRYQESGARAMESHSTTMEELGRNAGGTFEDFASLGALYFRMYSATTPTYNPSDGWLFPPALRLNNTITEACKAVVG